MWHAIRWPVVALVVSLVLVGVAFILDAGSSSGRDAALIVGTVAMYVLVPLSVIWLVVAAVLHRRRPG